MPLKPAIDIHNMEPQTLIMEKKNMEKIIMEKKKYGKTGQSALAP